MTVKKIAFLVIAIIIIFFSGCTVEKKTLITEENKKQNNTLFTSYPDGSEYVSYDNGVTWYCNGFECDTPIICLTVDDNQEFFLDAEFKITVHNNIDEWLSYSGNPYLHFLKDGEWIFNPYKKIYPNSLLALAPNADVVLKTFYINTDDSQKSIEGLYKYTKEFTSKENGTYICSCSFYVENR